MRATNDFSSATSRCISRAASAAISTSAFALFVLVPVRGCLRFRQPTVGDLGRPAAHARFASSSSSARQASQREANQRTLMYLVSVAVAGVGITYASVPLYKMFCQATGFGGETMTATMEQAAKMVPVADADPITVTFVAQTSDSMPWKFKPQQRSVSVVPGETALAFYKATNPTDKPIIGVSTYNVTPLKAGVHFHKIQCFCFDEQRLGPNEEVDMPVFFYIDPDFLEDPQMRGVKDIVLSYCFFKSRNQDVDDE